MSQRRNGRAPGGAPRQPPRGWGWLPAPGARHADNSSALPAGCSECGRGLSDGYTLTGYAAGGGAPALLCEMHLPEPAASRRAA